MYNRRYEKVFLMLRQETAGYALGKRPPWGSCIMELKNGKGRLSLTMQGLRWMRYDVYVMAGKESIFCGEVYPEKKEGRCELKWDFDPDAIGEGKKTEDFRAVLVLADEESAPLTAYFGEKTDWRADFIAKKQEKVILQAAEKQEDVKKEEPQPVEDMSYHGSFQGLLAKFRQELEELEETGILTKEETEDIRNMGAESEVEARETTEKKAEGSLFRNNRELSPFGDGVQWKQISLEEMVLLSEIPLKWEREFFFLLPCRKYQHLIFREEEDGIRLGLPNRYDERDAADGEKFGFGEFRRVEGDWGYWMCFLERNG